MGTHRRARRQQFFSDDQAGKVTFFTTTILPGPGHPNPALSTELRRKFSIVPGDKVRVRLRQMFFVRRNEFADPVTKLVTLVV